LLNADTIKKHLIKDNKVLIFVVFFLFLSLKIIKKDEYFFLDAIIFTIMGSSDQTIHIKIVERSPPQEDLFEHLIFARSCDRNVKVANILSPAGSHLDQACG